MNFMLLINGSQRDYDVLSGKGTDDRRAWTPEEVGALGAFMEGFNKELVESGELVETRGLTAPVHTRRIELRDDVPVVTDGPYAETQEVLAGYWIVDCESFDRATEIASRLANTPHPDDATLDQNWYVDIRPIAEARPDLEM